jgi:hypothetical protein
LVRVRPCSTFYFRKACRPPSSNQVSPRPTPPGRPGRSPATTAPTTFEKALYSVPGDRIGQWVQARADSRLVKISEHGLVLREHPRKAPGGRSTFPEDLPEHKRAYAMRDIEYLKRQAAGHGEQIAVYAARLLDDPLPWTRMRRVYRLLSLIKRFGVERVEEACRRTLELDLVDVVRVQRMLERALERERQENGGLPRLAPILRPRFARDPSEFAVAKENDRA